MGTAGPAEPPGSAPTKQLLAHVEKQRGRAAEAELKRLSDALEESDDSDSETESAAPSTPRARPIGDTAKQGQPKIGRRQQKALGIFMGIVRGSANASGSYGCVGSSSIALSAASRRARRADRLRSGAYSFAGAAPSVEIATSPAAASLLLLEAAVVSTLEARSEARSGVSEARSGVRRRSAAHDARRRDIADAELCDLASLSRDRPTSGAHRASWWFALRQSNNSEERNALEHAREGRRRERREPAEGPDADGQAGAAPPPLRQPAARDAERHGAALNGPRPHADPDGRDAVAVLHRAAR